VKKDAYIVKQAKRQQNYKKKKDKENENSTKYNLPYS